MGDIALAGILFPVGRVWSGGEARLAPVGSLWSGGETFLWWGDLLPCEHFAMVGCLVPVVRLCSGEETCSSWEILLQLEDTAKQTAGKPEGRTDGKKTRGPNKQLENQKAEFSR